MPDPVPARYLGLWWRPLLEQGGISDTTTRVFWLQTRRWHGDVRLPPGRPDFTDIASLQECPRDHLQWLLRQEGFAGITRVEGDRCVWLRQFDYHPTGIPDIGHMRFAGQALEETGVAQEYFERWERVSGAGEPYSAHRSYRDGRPRLLLRTGACFMYFQPRGMSPQEAELAWGRVAVQQAAEDEMRRLADFEISFGSIAGTEWRIRHSTLPWREGHVLPLGGNWVDLDADIARKETR